MNIEHVLIGSVRVDERNVRTHSKRNLETIKRSLEAFGQQKPIVVGVDGLVVAGNGTLDAARALGWSHIDVVRTALKGSARKAYAVADNRTAELAEWDETGLAEFLAGLKADETFDETVTGFDEADIEALLGRFEVDETGMPVLKHGDRSPFQQMTFTLHDDQVESVKGAMAAAKAVGPFGDTGNENSNGNALARIAEAYVGAG